MKLDSARELKQSLMGSMFSPAEVAARSRAVGVARRATEAVMEQRGVALGISQQRKSDYALAVRVQHRGYENSDYVQRIRAQAHGEVDLAYVGRVVKRAVPGLQDENRPLRIGCSVGHFRITAGTLGCIVRNSKGDMLILSNNHVLADENRARKGDAILQPGDLDGGKRPGSVVAKLKTFTSLKKRGVNLVDSPPRSSTMTSVSTQGSCEASALWRAGRRYSRNTAGSQRWAGPPERRGEKSRPSIWTTLSWNMT